MPRMTSIAAPLSFLAITCLPARAHADAGDVSVTLGGERYSLTVETCEGTPDAFTLLARGGIEEGALLRFSAHGGEDVRTLGFRSGDTMAQATDEIGTFDGSTFRFDGDVQVYTLDAVDRKKMSVVATCR